MPEFGLEIRCSIRLSYGRNFRGDSGAYYVLGDRRGKEIYHGIEDSDRQVEDPVEEETNIGQKTLEIAVGYC
jgi:hypothetical protein